MKTIKWGYLLTIINILLLIIFIFWILFSPTYRYDFSYVGGLSYIPTILRGEIDHSDLAQDIIGFRAMLSGENPYPILHDAASILDIDWETFHSSTHPPTAFLLVAPIAFLPWPIASAVWGWLMILAILFSCKGFGLNWSKSIFITLISMLWPPTIFSLGQITPIWLLGIALAFRYRNTKTYMAGIWIGIASLGKLFPVLMLIPLLIKRQWKALIGFGVLFAISLGILTLISPSSIKTYFVVNSLNSLDQMMRIDNGSLLAISYRELGPAGLVTFLLFFLAIILFFYTKFTSTKITMIEWISYLFLSVAMLPVAWTYSLLPLLPGLIYFLNLKKIPGLIALLSLIIPIIIFPVKVTSPLAVALCISLFSISLFTAIIYFPPGFEGLISKNFFKSH